MRNYSELLRKRILLSEECKTNDRLRSTALYQCGKDIVFWFDNYAWTYDPRVSPSNLPFILHQKQIYFIKWLDDILERSRHGEKINALVDKPRDVGVTYTVMGWCLWHYLFDDFVARVGSRKEDYVDNRGETDTLFFKLDYIMDRLPYWMIPEDWKKNRSYMMFGKPNSDNAISGESANPNFGRGGRKSVTVFDEYGFWEWAKSSWESSGESTNFRLALSTPPETGRDSHFYKLLTGQKGKIEKFEFDWTDVPSRNEAWLKQQKETKSDEEFNREVLKSFEGTVEGKVYASDFRFARLTNTDYNPNLPLFISWDFGLDETAMLWFQKDFETNRVYIIDSYNHSDESVDYFIPLVKGTIVSEGHIYTPKELEIIDRHRYWKAATHFGDPDVSKRSYGSNKISAKDTLEKEGIYIQTHCRDESGHLAIKEMTRLLFRRLEVNESRCEYFLDAIRNARYPKRNEGNQSTTPILKPIHDWTCLSGDTKIRTLNGWTEIKKLVGKEFWTYSYSFSERRIVPVMATKCWKTYESAPLIEVGLDNGMSIKTTPEHLFLMRNEIYKRCDELSIGDSLMPFYEHNNRGYIRDCLNCSKEFNGDHKTFYCSKRCTIESYNKRNSLVERKKRGFKNHKIRFIKSVEKEPVYDIEVPYYNNFVAEGVVVHNSHYRTALEYFVDNEPSREKIGAVLTKQNEELTTPSIIDGLIEEHRARKESDWRYQ